MQDLNEDTTGASPRELVDRYAALRLELTALHAEPVPDVAAIDAVIKRLDSVHMELKAINSRAEDPQRF